MTTSSGPTRQSIGRDPSALMPHGCARYLTFRVDEEEYGVDILRVQEIKGYTPLTPIPNAPPSVRGVMNLRGAVVPVVGLRETFGLSPTRYDKFSVIVVLSLGARVVGLLVDAVTDVVDLSVADLDFAPELAARVDTSFIAALGRSEDKFVIVLAVDRVIAGLDVGDTSLTS